MCNFCCLALLISHLFLISLKPVLSVWPMNKLMKPRHISAFLVSLFIKISASSNYRYFKNAYKRQRQTHLNLPLFFPLIVLVRFDVWRKAFRGSPTSLSLMYPMLEGEAVEDSKYKKVSKLRFVSRSHMLDHHAKLVSHQQSQLPT